MPVLFSELLSHKPFLLFIFSSEYENYGNSKEYIYHSISTYLPANGRIASHHSPFLGGGEGGHFFYSKENQSTLYTQ